MSGPKTHTTSSSATTVGSPHDTLSCQYRNAASMACAPCAKLKIPDVVYVSTSPEAAIA